MDPLEAIKVTFFQECDELLADLESGLLSLEQGEGDSETINAIFRAVHSVKGGAGAFGLDPLVAFAHVFESTLDYLRTGKVCLDVPVIRVLLRATDVLVDQVQAARTGAVTDDDKTRRAVSELQAIADGGGAPAPAEQPVAAPPAKSATDEIDFGFSPVTILLDETSDPTGWRVTFTPTAEMYRKANDAVHLLRELDRLGSCETSVDVAHLPSLAEIDPEGAYLTWTALLRGDVDEASVREIFDFVEGDCSITIEPLEAGIAPDAASSPVVDIRALLARVAPVVGAGAEEASTVVEAPRNAPPEERENGRATAAAGATIRVDLERVDRLIDLVGELVINQAMLAQRVGDSTVARSSDVAIGLEELEQLTREIQDSVMAIRAQPVRSVFQRMPRLVREAATLTNKQVRLVMEGEGVEVDKTVIEKLTDPITHMLRNAVDHGLESTERRLESGKAPEGVIRLSAQHRSGRVIIEVSDDGAGINRTRVRDIAVQRGLVSADATLSDDEVDNLIFLPGFSTASTVSNISGRGVGMDVVRRSIQALGGRISISSSPGRGSKFTLSLPLTLAVLDGMVVSVADHTLVAPLTTIVETLQPKAAEVHRVGPVDAVLAVRGAFVPLIDVGQTLGWRTDPVDATQAVAILVETEGGGRAALLVDDIQGQRQVVIKSLEANYQRVDGIAAATILGDGRVALILDIDTIVNSRANPATGHAADSPRLATG